MSEISAAIAAAMSRREWLLSDRPQSRLQARLGRAYMTWRRFSRQPAGRRRARHHRWRCILVAIFADVLAPHSPVIGDLAGARLLPPGSGGIWLGTDDQGRDILSRLIYGSRLTLLVVVLVAIIAAPIGLLGRHRRRLCRRLGRCGADAHHRYLPCVSEAGSGARLRRRPRARASRMPSSPSRSPPGRPMRASPAPRR